MSRTVAPARSADIWLRQADGENALVDRPTGSVHLLNDTALAIWELCDGQTLPEEMVEAICELCGLPVEVVTEDVEQTLHQFEHAGLITWRELTS